MIKHSLFVVLFLNTIFCLTTSGQQRISRIEPPNWWTEMKNNSVELLMYGNNIGDFNPSVNYDGLRIERVIKVENPNYLFVDLVIDEAAKPGKVQIDFFKDKKLVESHTWELWQREAGSAQREGFNNADVLYLITPDRFANGDSSNDEVAGMKEKPNRSFKGGRHGGDIEGIRQHLDYIARLGFTAIWLNPVLENNMAEYSYHGYSTTDFYKVDPRFGTNDSYRQLAQEAKANDVKLIMDMIVNHCGLEHWWMKDLPASDWINSWDTYTQTNHRKTLLQDPYASEYDKKILSDGWFVPTMPDLNQRNELLANYLTQNAIWWIEYLGLAGIRMDTYPYPDIHYMTEWTRRIMEEYPYFNVVGEEWFENPAIVAYWQRGKNNPNGYTSYLPGVMDFPVEMQLAKALNAKEEWKAGWINLYEMLALDFVYPNPENLVTFPDNHDMSRFFTQVNEDFNLFKLGLTFILTTRGVPQIYYGTEILMKNPGTTDHGIIRSDFPGGWAADTVNAFTGEGLTSQQKEATIFLKKLLQWRKNTSAVQTGKLTHFEPKDGVYVYFRYDEQQKVMVILNKNESPYSLKLNRFAEMLKGVTSGKDALSGLTFDMSRAIDLPLKSPLILELH
ncbi:MAG: alpha-amlyase [Saprospiraceae bacterium]|nr:MAG: alpha-amlyase [Saprospiraceae bacterium]